jgi:hypothetical protein
LFNLRGKIMRKLTLLAVALLAAFTYAQAAVASDPITTPAPASQEGCVSPAGDTCTYTSTRTGGYAAGGSSWSLVVSIPTSAGDPRDVNLDGQLTYTFGPAGAPPQGCALWGPGATVTISAGSSGTIAAGNPFPAPTDGQTTNPCAGGTLPDRSDAIPQ